VTVSHHVLAEDAPLPLASTAAVFAWWARLRQPTLQRRSVAYVLFAFVVIWAVLLGYVYLQNERTIARERPLRRFTEALHRALEATPQPAQADAVLRATLAWLNERRAQGNRFPPGLDAELLDASGARVHASPQLQTLPASAWQRDDPAHIGDRDFHLHETRGPIWTLRVAEPVRTTGRFLSYNASFLLQYLLLALPFIVLPVWWSVRSGLRPLAQLAEALRRRRDGDLRPLDHPVRHRELQPLADAVEGLLAQLRRKLDGERAFVQDAAHEIRTPLAVIGTQAHVLAHAADAAERRRAATLLNEAIARASRMAHQLLMLATLDDGGRPGTSTHVDVAQSTRVLLAQVAPQAMERGIELALDAPDQLWATLDAPAFGSILGNLVDNAIRYGRERGNIVVTLGVQGGSLRLQVRDDGPGIAQAEHALVFERFYRVAGNERPGSGLGLAIVRQAALSMGGQVELTPGLDGAGVGFVVSLPAMG
jgi:two-component system sensor histidine kinase QseC